jgi:hypothetical protein
LQAACSVIVDTSPSFLCRKTSLLLPWHHPSRSLRGTAYDTMSRALCRPGVVAQICNLCSLGGGDQEDSNSRIAQAKKFESPHLSKARHGNKCL